MDEDTLDRIDDLIYAIQVDETFRKAFFDTCKLFKIKTGFLEETVLSGRTQSPLGVPLPISSNIKAYMHRIGAINYYTNEIEPEFSDYDFHTGAKIDRSELFILKGACQVLDKIPKKRGAKPKNRRQSQRRFIYFKILRAADRDLAENGDVKALARQKLSTLNYIKGIKDNSVPWQERDDVAFKKAIKTLFLEGGTPKSIEDSMTPKRLGFPASLVKNTRKAAVGRS